MRHLSLHTFYYQQQVTALHLCHEAFLLLRGNGVVWERLSELLSILYKGRHNRLELWNHLLAHGRLPVRSLLCCIAYGMAEEPESSSSKTRAHIPRSVPLGLQVFLFFMSVCVSLSLTLFPSLTSAPSSHLKILHRRIQLGTHDDSQLREAICSLTHPSYEQTMKDLLRPRPEQCI